MQQPNCSPALTYLFPNAAAILPPVLLLRALSDLRKTEFFVDWDILGPLEVVGLGTSIISTPGEDGTVPENTSTMK
jgi:hypothetical protein